MRGDPTAAAGKRNIEAATVRDILIIADEPPVQVLLPRGTTREIMRILHIKESTDGRLFATIKENAAGLLEQLDGNDRNSQREERS